MKLPAIRGWLRLGLSGCLVAVAALAVVFALVRPRSEPGVGRGPELTPSEARSVRRAWRHLRIVHPKFDVSGHGVAVSRGPGTANTVHFSRDISSPGEGVRCQVVEVVVAPDGSCRTVLAATFGD